MGEEGYTVTANVVRGGVEGGAAIPACPDCMGDMDPPSVLIFRVNGESLCPRHAACRAAYTVRCRQLLDAKVGVGEITWMCP